MTIEEKLRTQIAESSKLKENRFKVSILRFALGEVETDKFRKGNKFSNCDAEKIIRKIINNNLEMIRELEKFKDEKLNIEKIILENKILENIIPKIMTEKEIISFIEENIGDKFKEEKNTGKRIGIVVNELKKSGKSFDGKTVSKVVNSF